MTPANREERSVPDGWSTDYHVSRWQEGDDASFEALYLHFAPLLRARVRQSSSWSWLASRVEVEDVVQEIWGRVIDYAKGEFTSRGKGSFLALLRKLCDTTQVNLLRKYRAKKRGGGESEDSLGIENSDHAVPIPGRPAPQTVTSAVRCSEIEDLARERLTPHEFVAWRYVELLGYSTEEVGGVVLDCSDSAVRGLRLRAAAKLVRSL